MTPIEKKLILEQFTDPAGLRCGLCGDIRAVASEMKFLELRPPTTLDDVIPVCKSCRAECPNHRVEHYRREIRDTRALIVEGKRWKYERAIKYGMKPLEEIKVVFYYEKLARKKI